MRSSARISIKAAALIMALLFLIPAAGCIKDIKENVVVDIGVTDDPSAAESAAPVGDPTDAPSEQPSAEPTDLVTSAPTEQATDTPTEAVTETPTVAPTAETPAPSTPAPATPAPATPAPVTPAPSTPAPVTPAPTAPVSATPTPEPVTDGSISFSESASLPLPGYYGEGVPQGQPFTFGGIVTSSDPLTAVTAVVANSSGTVVINQSVTFNASESVTRVELCDRTFPKTGNNSLTAKTKIGELPAGSYIFSLYASTSSSTGVLLKSRGFKVVGGEWRQLISNNLRNSYAYALQFFGSRDEFMFEYKWNASTGRDITLRDSSWGTKHMTTVTNPSGGHWTVHKKAAPGFNTAVNYLKTTYVRVHGTNGDSGVIKLSDLISSFDGTWNPRFVSDRSFISHHAFGAAIDLNAAMDANVNNVSNRSLIKTEVRDKLTYTGIKTANGVSYYDFEYTGSHSNKYKGVPTTVINYLLYELAFYRAGFNWGYYYDHTCDAMHFGLSEMSPNIHNTSSRSLRKVYEYIS